MGGGGTRHKNRTESENQNNPPRVGEGNKKSLEAGRGAGAERDALEAGRGAGAERDALEAGVSNAAGT